GIYTGFVRIVKRVLGLMDTAVKISMPDTRTTLDSGPTVASRGTVMGGKALFLAAQQLKQRMADVASQILTCPVDDLIFENDSIRSTHSSKVIEFKELVEECRRRGVGLKEDAWNRATGINWDKEKGQGIPWVSYSWAAHV